MITVFTAVKNGCTLNVFPGDYSYTIIDPDDRILDGCGDFSDIEDAKKDGLASLITYAVKYGQNGAKPIVGNQTKPFVVALKYQMALAEEGKESVLVVCGNGMFKLKE
jgi:hypothetical protein